MFMGLAWFLSVAFLVLIVGIGTKIRDEKTKEVVSHIMIAVWIAIGCCLFFLPFP